MPPIGASPHRVPGGRFVDSVTIGKNPGTTVQVEVLNVRNPVPLFLIVCLGCVVPAGPTPDDDDSAAPDDDDSAALDDDDSAALDDDDDSAAPDPVEVAERCYLPPNLPPILFADERWQEPHVGEFTAWRDPVDGTLFEEPDGTDVPFYTSGSSSQAATYDVVPALDQLGPVEVWSTAFEHESGMDGGVGIASADGSLQLQVGYEGVGGLQAPYWNVSLHPEQSICPVLPAAELNAFCNEFVQKVPLLFVRGDQEVLAYEGEVVLLDGLQLRVGWGRVFSGDRVEDKCPQVWASHTIVPE